MIVRIPALWKFRCKTGVALKVTGSSRHLPTAGVLCNKVSRYTERTYHTDRLLYPQRRIGAKGAGQFERISWDDAISTIAERLLQVAARGPERIAPYSYAGTMGLVQGDAMGQRLFQPDRRQFDGPHDLLERRAQQASS